MYLLAQAASILTVRYDSRRLVVDLELFRYHLINIEDTNRKQDATILSLKYAMSCCMNCATMLPLNPRTFVEVVLASTSLHVEV